MTRDFFRNLCIGLVALIAVAGCSSTKSNEDGCEKGKITFCRCANRASGSKICNADGKTYGECDCGDAEPDDVAGSGLDSPEDPSPANPPPVPPTDPTTDPAKEDPSAPAPNCSKLEDLSPVLVSENVQDDAPEALGGPIKPGTYVQTWMVYFRGADGAQPAKDAKSSQSIEIGEGTGRYTVQDNNKPAQSAGFRFSTTDNKITIQPECPSGPSKTLTYSASTRQLVIFDGAWARYFELQEAEAPAPEEQP